MHNETKKKAATHKNQKGEIHKNSKREDKVPGSRRNWGEPKTEKRASVKT